jgi:hypothetical protein
MPVALHEYILALSALGVAAMHGRSVSDALGWGLLEKRDKAGNFFWVDLYNSSDTGSTWKR